MCRLLPNFGLMEVTGLANRSQELGARLAWALSPASVPYTYPVGAAPVGARQSVCEQPLTVYVAPAVEHVATGATPVQPVVVSHATPVTANVVCVSLGSIRTLVGL